MAALVYSLVAPDRYGAEMSLAVGEKRGVVSPELGDQAQAVTNTVAQLIKSDVVARAAIAQAKLDTTPSEFLEKLKTEQKPDAAVLSVTFEADNKQQAVAALAAVDKAFQAQYAKVGADIKPLPRTASGDLPQEPLQVKVRVFDPPHAMEKKISPRPLRNIAVAMLLGLMIAVFWTAFRESRRGDEPAGQKPRGRDSSSASDGTTGSSS